MPPMTRQMSAASHQSGVSNRTPLGTHGLRGSKGTHGIVHGHGHGHGHDVQARASKGSTGSGARGS